MITFNMEVKNADPILRDLLGAINDVKVAGSLCISRLQSDDESNAGTTDSLLGVLGLKASRLPEIANILGIRSITTNTLHDFEALSKLNVALPSGEIERYVWAFFKDDAVIEELRSLFRNCSTVAFDDWANMTGASLLWNGLLTDVIKPLGRKDLEFIFYLGDSSKKLSFEVDEAVDIISAFSNYGKVTLALDDNEALRLWMVLNGVKKNSSFEEETPSDLKKKYISLFRTMKVAQLLIWSGNDVLLFSEQEQFIISRKQVDPGIEMSPDARRNYSTGFSIGLLMQLDITHCILLGLIVYASFGELKACPQLTDLTEYIQRWIDDLQKPGSIQLYED
ncbi:hypothetical protein SNE25_16525 [Mucilaginibacter sabulilitoris]|uniref:Uncharacterized protein n=1 Tax=Mucilaginibacter sabulilitoris TaxID=1173583 RepID=A0ABZ0TCI0_9SPHI|nr:hypothetical protein [Mucilaginibacter sabulilitoris]WPU90926.1 hypothetical protein SNE25_16525 [Mucilaginibacter sabulilitoris]